MTIEQVIFGWGMVATILGYFDKNIACFLIGIFCMFFGSFIK